MKNPDERDAFSERLKVALKNAGHRVDSPTTLVRAFNKRFAGNPVSVNAARKWLYGEAIPGQDKIRTLAEWLGVTTEYLRFGDGGEMAALRSERPHPDLDYNLMRAIAALNPAHQKVVSKLVRALADAEGGDAERFRSPPHP